MLGMGSFTCRKPTTWDRRLYFPSEGSARYGFLSPIKIHHPITIIIIVSNCEGYRIIADTTMFAEYIHYDYHYCYYYYWQY
jgi:hypothetical protein